MNKGFTLIELMVTISILAILSMIATPSMIEIIRKQQLASDARSVIESMSIARSDAIIYRKKQTVSFVANDDIAPSNVIQLGKHTHWSIKPSKDLSFTMFGSLEENAQCYVLEHQNKSTLKAVIVIHKNGSIDYDKMLSTCPNMT